MAVRQRSTPRWVRNYYEADEASSPRRRLQSPRNPAVPSPSSLIPLSSSSKSTERRIDSDYGRYPFAGCLLGISRNPLSFSFPRSTRTLRCRSLGESTSSERPAPSETASLELPPPAGWSCWTFWYTFLMGMSSGTKVYLSVFSLSDFLNSASVCL